MGILAQWVRPALAMPPSHQSSWDRVLPLLQVQLLLRLTLKVSRWQLKYSAPCHPCGKSNEGPCLWRWLCSVPAVAGIWGVTNEWEISLSTFLLVSFCFAIFEVRLIIAFVLLLAPTQTQKAVSGLGALKELTYHPDLVLFYSFPSFENQ